MANRSSCVKIVPTDGQILNHIRPLALPIPTENVRKPDVFRKCGKKLVV